MTLTFPQGDFEAYIFDCDGTLVDSMPLHYRAWSASFIHHDAPFEFSEKRFYASAGVPDRETVASLNAQHGCELDADSIHDHKLEYFFQHMHELEAVHAVADVLRSIHGKLPVSVASGSDITLVEPSLKIVDLDHFFEIIVTPADVERGKPAPDMFLLAAEKMGIAPEKCLVFEDGQAGIDAANAAGMQSVFVPSGPAH
ncbi:MAG: HAD family phosphatase [Verrucomicrobiota bacterium]